MEAGARSAKDPYRYFRIEARELLDGLTQGTLALPAAPAPAEAVARLLRLAHTLKGAARVVKQPAIAEKAHAIEDLLSPHRDGQTPVGAESASALLRLVDFASSMLSALDAPPPPPPVAAPDAPAAQAAQAPAPAPARPAPGALAIAETVRIEIGDMDAVLESVSESSARVSALRGALTTLGQAQLFASAVAEQLRSVPAPAPEYALAEELGDALERTQGQLQAGIDRAERELFQLQDLAGRLRLVAADTLFAPLARAARDAAQSTGKTVEFSAAGGEVRLEAHVLSALRDALLHVVRNAVAHGIESAPERADAGKPPQGLIHLLVERRGQRVAFVCRDDGRGIDVEGVRRAASTGGLLSPREAAEFDEQQAARLIFRAGVSTSRTVTEVSGRGVGLDVVQEVAARLKGEAHASSRPGAGTTIEICVPISLSSLDALSGEVAGAPFWIPLDAVARALRVEDAAITRASEGDSLLHDGRAIPFLALSGALGGDGALARPKAWSVVLVRSGDALAALGVDRLRGVGRIIVRALPKVAGGCALVAGATLDPEGHPQLVLDADALVQAARAAKGARTEAAPARRLPILVIDDSLTTRMLEQSILESAGYEVELAVSAEEALVKARERRYGLFLVDVEMPGMNGFEFVARTKSDPDLRDVPSILVTSLGSPDHRRRGLEAGAQAHIVKGEFDEGRLRRLIRDLVG